MKVFVVDVETTIRNPVGQGASAYYLGNKLVAVGVKCLNGDDDTVRTVYLSEADHHIGPRDQEYLFGARLADVAVDSGVGLVGHNITFDLHWLWRYVPGLAAPHVLKNIDIWDTQQAEYLLSAQEHMYPSLDELSVEIGLPVKDDKIKKYWDDGVDTFDIPEEELLDYLRQDVDNTAVLYEFQQTVMRGLPKLAVLSQFKMQDILCTAMMERNGMHFDLAIASEYKGTVSAALADQENSFSAWLISNHPTLIHALGSHPGPSITSNKDLITMIYGGEYVYAKPELVGYYKTGPKAGTPKYKKVAHKYTFLPLVKPYPGEKMTVGEEQLTDIIANHTGCVAELCNIVLAHRSLNKELSTYLVGYSQLVLDDYIHPSLNHCSTATGRMSCTQPNLQNVSKNED